MARGAHESDGDPAGHESAHLNTGQEQQALGEIELLTVLGRELGPVPLSVHASIANGSRMRALISRRDTPLNRFANGSPLHGAAAVEDIALESIRREAAAIGVERRVLPPHLVSGHRNMYGLGFALVEHYFELGSHDNAPETLQIDTLYQEWVCQPHDWRRWEMWQYLVRNDAKEAAVALLGESEVLTTLAKVNINFEFKEPTGDVTIHFKGSDPITTHWRNEGILAALFVMREHRVARSLYNESLEELDDDQPVSRVMSYGWRRAA